MPVVRAPLSGFVSWLRRARGHPGASGLLLLAVSVGALVMANSPLAAGWHAVFETPLGWAFDPALASLHGWIDHGLMALFFFTVGLEIKPLAANPTVNCALKFPFAIEVPIVELARNWKIWFAP